MSEFGEHPAGLPKWAERGNIPAKSPRPTAWTRFGLPGGLLAAFTLAMLVAGAYVVGRNSGSPTDGTTAAATTVAPSSVSAGGSVPSVAPAAVTTEAATSTVRATSTVAPSTTLAPTTTVAPAPTTLAPATTAPTTVDPVPTTVAPTISTVAPELIVPRTAVYTQGKIYLRGAVPNWEVANVIIDKAANVLGRANVIVEYVVDPRATAPNEGSLQVADTVLFTPNSASLAPDFIPILKLGVILLNQNPKITIDIIGHTDSDGSTETNQVLAARRCDAVIAYLVAAGVDPARLVAVPKGDSEPIADNLTPEGKRLNRRAEFIIRGLLDT